MGVVTNNSGDSVYQVRLVPLPDPGEALLDLGSWMSGKGQG